MIKLSRLTDYAVVILAEMAKEKDSVLSAAELSDRTNLPEPTVSKILKLLSGAGLVVSIRGVNGGYILRQTINSLKVTDVIEAMEGPISLTACVDSSHENCALESMCAMNGRWNKVNLAIRTALADVTLADMVR